MNSPARRPADRGHRAAWPARPGPLRYIHTYVSKRAPGPAGGTMTLTEQGRPNPRGEAMVAELKWVHDMIRHDLGLIRQMAGDAEQGRPASAIRGAIRSLASGSAVWQL